MSFDHSDWTPLKPKSSKCKKDIYSNLHESTSSSEEERVSKAKNKSRECFISQAKYKNSKQISSSDNNYNIDKPIVFSPEGNEGILVPDGVTVCYTSESSKEDFFEDDEYKFKKEKLLSPKDSNENSLSESIDIDKLDKTTKDSSNSNFCKDSFQSSLKANQQLILGVLERQPQLGSMESHSENTDSVNTVLDVVSGDYDRPTLTVQNLPKDADLKSIRVNKVNPTLSPKPQFIVGGLMSPRGSLNTNDLKLDRQIKNIISEENTICRPMISGKPIFSISEQEISLLSIESTNHPESSERGTSPSVMSLSSAASSKKLEWDSGADLGYVEAKKEIFGSGTSISTLERLAIGNCASVIRSEPEGMNYLPSSDQQKSSNKRLGKTESNIKSTSTKFTHVNIADSDNANSIPFESALLKHKYYKNKIKMSSSDDENNHKNSCISKESPRRKLRKRSTVFLEKSSALSKSTSLNKNRLSNLNENQLESSNSMTRYLITSNKADSLTDLATNVPNEKYFENANSKKVVQSLKDFHANNSKPINSKEKIKHELTKLSLQKKNISSKILDTENDDTKYLQAGSGISASTSGTLLADSSGEQNCCYESSFEEKNFLNPDNGKEINSCFGKNANSFNLLAEGLEKLSETNSNKIIRKNKPRKSKSVSTDSSKINRYPNEISTLDDINLPFDNTTSLTTPNNDLVNLSCKLRKHIHNLEMNGSVKKIKEYKKLSDYIEFIGVPSTTEEEIKIKQSVADIIMKMFTELQENIDNNISTCSSIQFTDTTEATDSSTHYLSSNQHISSATSESSDRKQIYKDENKNKVYSKTSSRDQTKVSTLPVKDSNNKEHEDHQHIHDINIVAYKPTSVAKTYYMTVTQGKKFYLI